MKNDLMIFEHKEHAVVSNRIVSDRFGKTHSEVLKTIHGENRGEKHIPGLIDGIRSSVKTPDLFHLLLGPYAHISFIVQQKAGMLLLLFAQHPLQHSPVPEKHPGCPGGFLRSIGEVVVGHHCGNVAVVDGVFSSI